jgi:hypothetical protein
LRRKLSLKIMNGESGEGNDRTSLEAWTGIHRDRLGVKQEMIEGDPSNFQAIVTNADAAMIVER